MKERNWLRVIGYPTSIIFVAFVILITYWLVYPYKTIEITGSRLLETDVKAGDAIHYELDYCKYTKKHALLTKSFVDGVVYRTVTKVSNVPCGCGTAIIAVDVPDHLPPATYYIRADILYKMNPIREIEVQYETDRFNVTGE